jgi:hypothetical protein
VRASLEALPGNAEKLKAIDGGIIMVCLDAAPAEKEDDKQKGLRLLVGDGCVLTFPNLPLGREWTWWTHTEGGNALQTTPRMRPGGA